MPLSVSLLIADNIFNLIPLRSRFAVKHFLPLKGYTETEINVHRGKKGKDVRLWCEATASRARFGEMRIR